MNQSEHREEALFREALLKPTEGERAAYLEEACRNEPALRARLEVLLEGHFLAQGFLDSASGSNAQPLPTALVVPITEKPGDRIGRYKLLQQIGEGGFGVVYMAEQTSRNKSRRWRVESLDSSQNWMIGKP